MKTKIFTEPIFKTIVLAGVGGEQDEFYERFCRKFEVDPDEDDIKNEGAFHAFVTANNRNVGIWFSEYKDTTNCRNILAHEVQHAARHICEFSGVFGCNETTSYVTGWLTECLSDWLKR